MLRQLRVLTGAERSGRFQTEGRYCGTGSATRATSCVGCPTRERGVSHHQEEKNRQERKQKARGRDSQIEGEALARSPTIERNGKRGCAAGARRGFGCPSGVKSRIRGTASHPPH